jgi:hypothetical protein
MWTCFRQQALLLSCAAKCRKFWLIAACILAPLSLAISDPALAQCTPLVGGNATCTGTFNSNINFFANNAPINLTLQPPVTVTVQAAMPLTPLTPRHRPQLRAPALTSL